MPPAAAAQHRHPLEFRDGHLFLELDGRRWLVDTGAPSSFGSGAAPTLSGRTFEIRASYAGLDAERLSQHVGVECAGLLGADILGQLDLILDRPASTAVASLGELTHAGTTVVLETFMGIPVIKAVIRGTECRVFFDTGAQVSYLRADQLAGFPDAGPLRDFYPGFGELETETITVECVIAGVSCRLRCGQLPPLLAASLGLAGTAGIIGNELLHGRVVGYFPRRGMLVI